MGKETSRLLVPGPEVPTRLAFIVFIVSQDWMTDTQIATGPLIL